MKHDNHLVEIHMLTKNTLQIGIRPIRYMGAKLWNELPLGIGNSTSELLFKRGLIIHFQTAL